MTECNTVVHDGVVVGDYADYSFSKANCVQIFKDLKFHIHQSQKENQEHKDLYARIAIGF